MRVTRVGLFSALAAAVALAAWGAASSSSAGTAGSGATSSSAVKIQVRVITASPITEGTWDPANYAAYKRVAAQYNWDLQIADSVPSGRAAQVLTTWGQQGVKAVFSTSGAFLTPMLTAARKFPKIKFIIMSSISVSDNLPNVAAYSIDWCQLGLVQGIAAGLVSKTHRIAAMQGIPILAATKEARGIMLGAYLANPANRVKVHLFNSVTDASKAAAATTAALGDGADVAVANVLGGTAGGVATAAQSAGAYYIGAYANEAHFAPKAVVTSAIVDFKAGYELFARQLVTGKFTPTIITTSIRSGSIKLQIPFHLGFNKTVQAKAQALVAKAARGAFNTQLRPCQAATT